MAIDTATDPNVAALRKRLSGQAAGADPAAVPAAAGGAAIPSISPDFASGAKSSFWEGPNPVTPPPPGSPWDTVMTPGPGGQKADVPFVRPPTPIRPGAPIPVPPPTAPTLRPMGSPGTDAYASAAAPESPQITTPAPVAPPVLGPDATTTPPPAPAAAAAPSTTGGAAGSVEDAVMQNYQQLGATPTGAGTGPTDSAYFIRRINETGGMTPENQSYWFGPNGRIAREMRGEVPPETGDAETPASTGRAPAVAGLAPPSASSVAPLTSTASAQSAVNPDAVGTNHRPGDGTGVPGVYDWDNAGRPVTAMGEPYTGAMADGSPNPWTSSGGTPAGGGAPAGSDFNSEIRKQLMARLAELGTPVDENSSGIAGAVSGARDEATRASQNERTALAERLYAQGGGGLGSNALTQQIQQSGEKNAASLGGLRANLMMQEYARKQSALQQTLSLAVQSGDAEAARAAQKAIADLQAQLQREGYSLDSAKYAAYLNQQAVLNGLGG